MPPEPPSFYAKRNCYYGASSPSPRELAGRHEIGVERILWGSDYPHYEGTFPHTRKAMRRAFHDVDRAETRAMLGENAARLYDFDLARLEALAAKVGPLPEELSVPLAPEEMPRDSASMAFL
jgi:predicted TIM-barrel fold metal-dependent hydrolase